MSDRLALPTIHPARRATANPATIPRASFIITSVPRPSLLFLGEQDREASANDAARHRPHQDQPHQEGVVDGILGVHVSSMTRDRPWTCAQVNNRPLPTVVVVVPMLVVIVVSILVAVPVIMTSIAAGRDLGSGRQRHATQHFPVIGRPKRGEDPVLQSSGVRIENAFTRIYVAVIRPSCLPARIRPLVQLCSSLTRMQPGTAARMAPHHRE
jgi:hypothetical protein